MTDIPKKRGRKPNGGKIINKPPDTNSTQTFQIPVMLHLRCKISDLSSNTIPPHSNNTYDPYIIEPHNNVDNHLNKCEEQSQDIINNNNSNSITSKLKELEIILHTNNVNDKKSACFYCTYPFDHHQFYIPKSYDYSGYKVYGCFCSPECATSFLFNEHLDSTVKFERYSILNNMYGSICKYTHNIKPAPNPYYMLDKFYGNLTIKEYRSLFKREHCFLILDKPLTRIMPELYEENENWLDVGPSHITLYQHNSKCPSRWQIALRRQLCCMPPNGTEIGWSTSKGCSRKVLRRMVNQMD